ncbi:hypothetical protein JOJ86_000036 [Rhodococcus percolatus]|nr:hypothetical protein [Rhodococcus opacus]MBP2202310.1 hypothetical protein [Rhodococcus opacus]
MAPCPMPYVFLIAAIAAGLVVSGVVVLNLGGAH